MNPLRGTVIGLAGLVGAGLLAWPTLAAGDTEDAKRDEQETELVTVQDDDDRDRDRDRDATNTNGARDRDVTNGDVTNNTHQGTRDRDATGDRSNG